MSLDNDLAFVHGEPLASYASIYHHLEQGLKANPHGIAVPLDYGALNKPREIELQNFMGRLKPNAIFVASEEDAQSVDLAFERIQQSKPEVCVVVDDQRGSETNGWISLMDLAVESAPTTSGSEILERARIEDPARISLIAFTSGTSSGNPKGCPRRVESDCFVIEAQGPDLDFDTHSKYLLASANFRIIAPALSLAAWGKGAAVVMPGPGFDPRTVMEAIQRKAITHVLLVPFQLHALVRNPSFDPEKTTSVKYAMFGGDMITKEVLRKARRSFPGAMLSARHGMTEGGALFHWPYHNTELENIPDFGGISTLGTVAPGSALRIYDIETDRVARRSERGEFQISSPSTIEKYLENVDQEAFVYDGSDRWFRTGDVGFIDEAGSIFLLGRLNDRIKRAGVPITPAALETSLNVFIGSQVSVLGIPHPELGHEPYAVTESFNGKSQDGVKQHVVDIFGEAYALAGACTLDHLGMSRFPVNATGKIMKMTLRDAVIKQLGR